LIPPTSQSGPQVSKPRQWNSATRSKPFWASLSLNGACQKGAKNESPDVEKMNAGLREEVVEAESLSGSVSSH